MNLKGLSDNLDITIDMITKYIELGESEEMIVGMLAFQYPDAKKYDTILNKFKEVLEK